MKNILLAEDSIAFGKFVKSRIESELGFKVSWAKSYKQTIEIIEKSGTDFFLGLLDINLPDAPEGETIDYVLSQKIPSIVFTANFSDAMRERFWEKRIVDYVLKEGKHNIDYIISIIRRLSLNGDIKILIVDDSGVSRKKIANLLNIHQYDTLHAANGDDALVVLKSNPDLKLIITDYNMPGMDGTELTKAIRAHYGPQEIAIIGMSAHGDRLLSAKFIKCGANDFMHKPFINEEIFCRVTQNIEMLEYIARVRDMSIKDHLTGLFNRRYFFDTVEQDYSLAKENDAPCALAMIDIDHFKKINDTHGHVGGDEVLRQFSRVMQSAFLEPKTVVSRFGGEEFCIFSSGLKRDLALITFEKFRKQIENITVKTDTDTIPFTISIGVNTHLSGNLEEMIKTADELLYNAKKSGRNRVKVL